MTSDCSVREQIWRYSEAAECCSQLAKLALEIYLGSGHPWAWYLSFLVLFISVSPVAGGTHSTLWRNGRMDISMTWDVLRTGTLWAFLPRKGNGDRESWHFSEKGTDSIRLARGRWLWYWLENSPEGISLEGAVGREEALQWPTQSEMRWLKAQSRRSGSFCF